MSVLRSVYTEKNVLAKGDLSEMTLDNVRFYHRVQLLSVELTDQSSAYFNSECRLFKDVKSATKQFDKVAKEWLEGATETYCSNLALKFLPSSTGLLLVGTRNWSTQTLAQGGMGWRGR